MTYKSSIILLLFFSILLSGCNGRERNDKNAEEAEGLISSTKLSVVPTLAIKPYVDTTVMLSTNVIERPEKYYPMLEWVSYENEQAFFDFDSGRIISTDEADLYLYVSCGTTCFNGIIDLNGSKSVFANTLEPGFSGCKDKLSGNDTVNGSSSIGTYSCFKTNEGNIVQVYIIDNEPKYSDSILEFRYRLWVENHNK